MTARRAILIRVGLGAVLVGILVFVAHVLIPREPTYEGQPFSYWVDRLPITMPFSFPGMVRGPATFAMPLIAYKLGTNMATSGVKQQYREQSETAVKAVDALGTNCLQLLVTRMGKREFPLKRMLTQWAVKLKLVKPPDLDVDTRRRQALTAIHQLRRRAEPIIPQLTILSRHSDTNISAAAKLALELIKRNENERKRDLWPPPPLIL